MSVRFNALNLTGHEWSKAVLALLRAELEPLLTHPPAGGRERARAGARREAPQAHLHLQGREAPGEDTLQWNLVRLRVIYVATKEPTNEPLKRLPRTAKSLVQITRSIKLKRNLIKPLTG